MAPNIDDIRSLVAKQTETKLAELNRLYQNQITEIQSILDEHLEEWLRIIELSVSRGKDRLEVHFYSELDFFGRTKYCWCKDCVSQKMALKIDLNKFMKFIWHYDNCCHIPKAESPLQVYASRLMNTLGSPFGTSLKIEKENFTIIVLWGHTPIAWRPGPF